MSPKFEIGQTLKSDKLKSLKVKILDIKNNYYIIELTDPLGKNNDEYTCEIIEEYFILDNYSAIREKLGIK